MTWYQYLFPKYCLICEQITNETLCPTCASYLSRYPNHCKSCFRFLSDQGICGQCLYKPPIFDHIQAVYQYQDTIRQIILKAKFHASRKHLDWMAMEMVRHIPSHWQIEQIIPMPISAKRLKQRGFNQTHYLSDKIAAHLKIKCHKTILVKENRPPQSQQTSKKMRYQNIKHAFTLKNEIEGHVLLIDDVSTSQATLIEAAKTLLQSSKIKSIHAYVLAATT